MSFSYIRVFSIEKNCNSIGPFTFCLAPPLKKNQCLHVLITKRTTFLFLMMPLDHAKYSSYKLPHFLLLFFFSFSFQYLVNLTTLILSIGLLGIIVLFRKSRRALPDHKPWQEISDDVFWWFFLSLCFVLFFVSQYQQCTLPLCDQIIMWPVSTCVYIKKCD